MGFLFLAHDCPLSQSSQRDRETSQCRRRKRRRAKERKDKELKRWEENEEARLVREQESKGTRGGRDKKLGCLPGSIPPLLSGPLWAATFSHLCNVINEKAFRRDGGLDSGFRMCPTPADAAKPSRVLFRLIGCHFQEQETRQVFSPPQIQLLALPCRIRAFCRTGAREIQQIMTTRGSFSLGNVLHT